MAGEAINLNEKARNHFRSHGLHQALESMKTIALLLLALFASLLPLRAVDTNTTRRISVAEVNSVRLELEQSSMQNELQIRVRDYSAKARNKATLSCDVYYLDPGTGRQSLVKEVTLSPVSSSSDVYAGTISSEKQFSHGNIAKVFYKSSNNLPWPISTWYVFYYH